MRPFISYAMKAMGDYNKTVSSKTDRQQMIFVQVLTMIVPLPFKFRKEKFLRKFYPNEASRRCREAHEAQKQKWSDKGDKTPETARGKTD